MGCWLDLQFSYGFFFAFFVVVVVLHSNELFKSQSTLLIIMMVISEHLNVAFHFAFVSKDSGENLSKMFGGLVTGLNSS